ncbi:hypothetical protein [Bacillus massiliglaciei]|uniref:hypothetical protein n=1 Tax=Bacillus massiliglaciei TaxID=1816693 RepID=UPI0018FE9E00|nr:hypothetical protein [Bacillus massiliglaciei]
MRRHRKPLPVILAALAVILVSGFWLLRMPGGGPEKTVREFYEYESNADFSSSYELLHEEMKERFPERAGYVQNKSHVFLQHMEVETFSFKVGNAEKVKNWKMDAEHKAHKTAYEVPVTLEFESRFGIFTIEQNCYAVKEKGEWKLLWDYHF